MVRAALDAYLPRLAFEATSGPSPDPCLQVSAQVFASSQHGKRAACPTDSTAVTFFLSGRSHARVFAELIIMMPDMVACGRPLLRRQLRCSGSSRRRCRAWPSRCTCDARPTCRTASGGSRPAPCAITSPALASPLLQMTTSLSWRSLCTPALSRCCQNWLHFCDHKYEQLMFQQLIQ